MIPYFRIIQFDIGPIPIRIWGLMVALGVVAAIVLSVIEAKRRGVPREDIIDLAFWGILGSMIGGRLLYVALEFSSYADSLIDVFKVWEGGMSIIGGFIGAFTAGWFYLRHKKKDFLTYSDIIIFGLPVGLWIGRLGCFFVYDHPGTPTSFFLGQEYIDGIVRHNHGLYLSLSGLLLMILFLVIWRIKADRKPGFYTALFLVWYGIVRFILDFFRATDLEAVDTRYAGLTMPQYAAIGMVVIGLGLWYYLYRYSPKNKKA
ncbi:MAG: prolipoprotein diacylglyceryl transferase [Candidatus Kerfeldbacteria bacterium]